VGIEAAAERLPRTDTSDGAYMERGEDGAYAPAGGLLEGDALEFCRATFGEGFEASLPVMSVTWDDAVAYCVWKTKTTGKAWRLPKEEEREKAARGVDGRRFPWGDLEDASLAKCRESREHSTQPEPVGAFETAVSVYGVADAAGGMWDWTDSWFDHRETSRVLRGGAWGNPPAYLRCTSRLGLLPSDRDTVNGFRCVRGL